MYSEQVAWNQLTATALRDPFLYIPFAYCWNKLAWKQMGAVACTHLAVINGPAITQLQVQQDS